MQELLIVLKGTIPTYHRGATYQTPVHLIIPYNYPMSAPTIYVKPTANMIIQSTHKYVNHHDGRIVNLPYLDQWNVRGCLVDAVLAVQSVFNAKPPLLARPMRPVAWAQNQSGGIQAANQYPSSGSHWSRHTTTNAAKPTQRQDDALAQVKAMLVRQLSQKLTNDIRKRFDSLRREINDEFKIHAKMSQRENAIKDGIVSLTSQKRDLAERRTQCEVKLKDIVSKLGTMEKLDDPSKMISPADVWSKQAFDLVATSNAFDDLIFSVEDALENGVIGVDEALRRVRQVARQQFMDKALAKRVFEAQRRHRNGT